MESRRKTLSRADLLRHEARETFTSTMAYGRCKHLDSILRDSVHASTDINGAHAADLAKIETTIRERQEEREILWRKEQTHYAKMRALHIADGALRDLRYFFLTKNR